MRRVLPGPGHVTSSNTITLSPSLRADPLGCLNLYMCTNEWNKSNNRSTYAKVQTHESHNGSVPYGCHLADPVHRETLSPLELSPEVVKTRADYICTGPRSNEVRSNGKRSEGWHIQSDTILHIATSGMYGIRPSNLALVTCTKCRSLSESDTVISVQSPIIV